MTARDRNSANRAAWAWTAGLIALAVLAPFFVYPVFVMKALCMALFACAFNLLIGYVGLLSFGHAAFFGMGSYLCAHAAIPLMKRRGGGSIVNMASAVGFWVEPSLQLVKW